LRPPKVCGPVQPNTSNMPKAGPGENMSNHSQRVEDFQYSGFDLELVQDLDLSKINSEIWQRC